MALRVDVQVNTAEVGAGFVALFQEQVPFATSTAINRALNLGQEAQRMHLRETFVQRRPRWQELNVKIRPSERATKTKLEGVVRMEAPGGGGRTDILAKFETEEFKLPFRGRSIAVPNSNTPRTGAGVIRKGWRPKDFRFRARGRGRSIGSKGDVFVGEKNTLLIKRPGGRGTIFTRQRVQGPAMKGAGRRVKELVAIYQLVPQVDIRPELDFEETVSRVIEQMFSALWDEAFLTAARFAR